MIPEDDWYNIADENESVENAMLTMPLYDEDGNEIPDEELPWNNTCEDINPVDDSEEWSFDVEREESLPLFTPDKHRRNADDARSAAERRKRIAQSVREEALRGNVPLESGAIPGGHILPHSLSQPNFRQICRGEFDDYLATCLFTMHDLTDRAHLREIVMNLKLDHKEILFFLGIRLYPTQLLASLRGQTERNIRKVRDTVRRRIHRKLYDALVDLKKTGDELIHLEQDFLRTYTPPKRRRSSNDESV